MTMLSKQYMSILTDKIFTKQSSIAQQLKDIQDLDISDESKNILYSKIILGYSPKQTMTYILTLVAVIGYILLLAILMIGYLYGVANGIDALDTKLATMFEYSNTILKWVVLPIGAYYFVTDK